MPMFFACLRAAYVTRLACRMDFFARASLDIEAILRRPGGKGILVILDVRVTTTILCTHQTTVTVRACT